MLCFPFSGRTLFFRQRLTISTFDWHLCNENQVWIKLSFSIPVGGIIKNPSRIIQLNNTLTTFFKGYVLAHLSTTNGGYYNAQTFLLCSHGGWIFRNLCEVDPNYTASSPFTEAPSLAYVKERTQLFSDKCSVRQWSNSLASKS